MSLADAALVYARRGLPVFPVWPAIPFRDGKFICGCGRIDCGDAAKHPMGRLVPNGLRDATTDAARVRHWWAARPDANIGVACVGMVVLDVDPRHGGDASLSALEEQHDVLPDTWTVRSGSGGRHCYFAAPVGVEIKNSSGQLAAGLDIRTGGGYVLAPPSRHLCGGYYQWLIDPDEAALAPLPDWLVAKLTARAAGGSWDATPSETWQRLTQQVREYPDAAAAQVFGHLLRRWVDPYLAASLLHAWNRAYVDPPIPDFELNRIINRIARLEDRRRDTLQGGDNA